MREIIKKGRMVLEGVGPMKIIEATEETTPARTSEHLETALVIAKTTRAYLEAGASLLGQEYRHLLELAPQHLANPGNALVACCDGGAVIRYESGSGEFQVAAATWETDLTSCALALSQNLVYCQQSAKQGIAPDPVGLEMKLFTETPGTRDRADLHMSRIVFTAVIPPSEGRPLPARRPFRLLSIRNSLEIQLLGELVPEKEDTTQNQRFIARSTVRLPVGWECIEVFPLVEPSEWKPECARTWAESDILASVVAQQFQESSLRSLDPNAMARREFGEKLSAFKLLLDSEPSREQELQSFLQNNPALLCPTQVRMWPKLSLGARQTDFVFRDASNDYLLVELERSTLRLFNSDGHPTAHLNHAHDQIRDWKRYLEDNLSTVQRELGLAGISVNPRSLVVIGRSSGLTQENRRSLVSMENGHPKLRVMTYDDVYENAKAVIENLLGPIWETTGETEIFYVR